MQVKFTKVPPNRIQSCNPRETESKRDGIANMVSIKRKENSNGRPERLDIEFINHFPRADDYVSAVHGLASISRLAKEPLSSLYTIARDRLFSGPASYFPQRAQIL